MPVVLDETILLLSFAEQIKVIRAHTHTRMHACSQCRMKDRLYLSGLDSCITQHSDA